MTSGVNFLGEVLYSSDCHLFSGFGDTFDTFEGNSLLRQYLFYPPVIRKTCQTCHTRHYKRRDFTMAADYCTSCRVADTGLWSEPGSDGTIRASMAVQWGE